MKYWNVDDPNIILKPCTCGRQPVIVGHYIKGVANTINYYPKCEHCKRRGRNRKKVQGAIDDWNNDIQVYDHGTFGQ